MNLILGAAIVLVFLSAAFLLVVRKLAKDTNLPAEDDWLQQVSAQRYRPLERLLDNGEYSRMKTHRAITPKMLRRLRSRRVSIFRRYLRYLSVDHGRICQTIKLLMVQSAQDRPDLAALLVRQRAIFTLRLTMAEFRLTLHALGAGNVDVAALVSSLDTMRLQLNSLAAAAQTSAA